ncbi:heat-shock protein Hsp70 [Candidatus Borreliella tachyglossi]|uniref:Heat-shock protein Hsp70 n=1 Tax=Candidatus Borreliella tachyglossi TaxID=1964448 RepID=A0A2S1LWL5_9SPIR|nr:Hsp70 family protein [Candidatus Borreliella tachyglossi]AWG42655.1 heat-shock protein Hsp70 [Candidatus Borreliella tachyglossi]
MKRWIGIDLGTTNTVATYFDTNSRVILNDRGERITPSVVSFTDSGVIIGSAAKHQMLVNPDKTFYNFKVNIGTGISYKVGSRSYRAEDIASYLLLNIKKNAEKFLETEVRDVVITVPAYFSEVQRRGVVEAASLAGLDCREILNEPTAAALYYAFEKQIDGLFLVYDLGGGTFDVTLLENQNDTYTVLSIKGENKLGGNDFNHVIEKHVLSNFKIEYIDIDLEDIVLLEQIRERIEEAKKNLSIMDEVNIVLPFLDGKHLNYTLRRDDFNFMIREFIDKTINLTNECITDAGIDLERISKIILSGGSTRIPYVKQRLKEAFPKVEVLDSLNQDEVVASGAGIQAFSLSNDRSLVEFRDVTPYSLGIETRNDGFFVLIERNTPLPVCERKIVTTTNDYQEEIEVHVLQGEYKRASLNYSIGRLFFSSIQKVLKGIPKIEILFSLDESGILSVSAIDLDTNASRSIEIRITSASDNRMHRDGVVKFLEGIDSSGVAEDEIELFEESILDEID